MLLCWESGTCCSWIVWHVNELGWRFTVCQFWPFSFHETINKESRMIISNILFTLNRTTRSSVLLLCVVRFYVNKTLCCLYDFLLRSNAKNSEFLSLLFCKLIGSFWNMFTNGHTVSWSRYHCGIIYALLSSIMLTCP